MPNIKSAKKKMRQDVKRTKKNATYKRSIQDIMKKATQSAGADKSKHISESYAAIDKAAKKGVIHKNKAARMKSQISRKKVA
jgi:small subunit ribosomal protein S20